MSFASRPDSLPRSQRKAEFFSPENILHTFRKNLTLLRAGLILVLSLYLFSGVRFVGVGESAIVVRMGEIHGPVRESGLVISFPPPIDQVHIIPTGRIQEVSLDDWVSSVERFEEWREQTMIELEEDGPDEFYDDPELFMLRNLRYTPTLHPVVDGYTVTGDANILQGIFRVQYRISDARRYFLNVHNDQNLVQRLAYQAAARSIAELGIDAIFSEEQSRFLTESRNRLQESLDGMESGIRVQGFIIDLLLPPIQTREAFDSVITAQVETRTELERARSEAATLQRSTNAEANRIRVEAEAARRDLVAMAEGRAEAFNLLRGEAALNPGLFRSRHLLEVLERVYEQAETSTLVPGADGSLQIWLPGDVAHDDDQ